jgi:hypothetical protein
LNDSEKKRAQLQDALTEAAGRLEVQTGKSKLLQEQVMGENRQLHGELARHSQLISQMEGDRISLIAQFHKDKSEMAALHQAQLQEKDFKIKELLQLNLQQESVISQQMETIRRNEDIAS